MHGMSVREEWQFMCDTGHGISLIATLSINIIEMVTVLLNGVCRTARVSDLSFSRSSFLRQMGKDLPKAIKKKNPEVQEAVAYAPFPIFCLFV